MKRSIEVIVGTAGEIQIEAVGFTGTDCEKATAFLDRVLGTVTEHRRKPEYYAQTKAQNQQQVGGA